MEKKNRLLIALIINFLMVVIEFRSLFKCTISEKGLEIKYYTIDSNILCFFSSLIFIIKFFLCFNKQERESKIDHFIVCFRYITTCGLTVTFIVVITILCPILGTWRLLLWENQDFYFHILCPFLSFFNFLFYEDNSRLTEKDVLAPLVLTIIYGIIALIMNFANIYEGPYPFLMVKRQSIFMTIVWFSIILSGTYGISYFIRYLYFKLNKNSSANEKDYKKIE